MSDPRLCLALDGCSPDEALAWITRTADVFSTFKVGLELFCRGGPDLVAACVAAGADQIFLDLKLHDIPRTVARAVEAAAQPGVRWLTVHTAGGPEMLAEAQRAAATTGVDLLGVTVLTSLDGPSAAAVGVPDLAAAVRLRAAAAAAAGLAGVVCSAEEAAEIKALFPALACVTPGIRWADEAAHDQRRVADPRAAVAAGADLLVIGRMVTAAPDPAAALLRLQAALT